ncbi:helix-turn-helix transcriptional regulator [Bacillus infantis]|uniref:helix-turn-helix domain-containing protein n=1 Tax=Bacillus infantis TaxID=324767 RepID=UPI002FBDB6B0
MEEYKEIVGQRLQYLRKKKKMPVQKILDKFDIARSTYTGWEKGRRTPKGETLVQLADLFNTTVDFITGKTDNEEQPKIELIELIQSGKVIHEGKALTDEKAEALQSILKVLLKEE